LSTGEILNELKKDLKERDRQGDRQRERERGTGTQRQRNTHTILQRQRLKGQIRQSSKSNIDWRKVMTVIGGN
jgi:hypothetical protein